ncbi:MAG: arginine decarboxylase, partial [Candidatus Kapaibacterium sp.]
IVDLTCDSDGKVDKFISEEGEQNYLPLHKLIDNEDYYLGFFLMGAYQDILGDMHNLFGRVNEVHVYADSDEPNNFYIEEYISGTKVVEALGIVQYFPSDLKKQIESIIRKRVKAKKLKPTQGVEFLHLYSKALEEYTYYNFWNKEKK